MSMSKPVQIWHNPKCSTSRQTLKLIYDHNVEPEIIEYLKTPLSKNKLVEILQLLGLSPRELMRKKETIYQELNLDNPKLSDSALIEVMIEHPVLIERPIVIAGDKAALGRPPENILKILL